MSLEFDENLKGCRLAFRKDGARDELGPCGFFWLGGFKSDMDGSKAEALAMLSAVDIAAARSQATRPETAATARHTSDVYIHTLPITLELTTWSLSPLSRGTRAARGPTERIG